MTDVFSPFNVFEELFFFFLQCLGSEFDFHVDLEMEQHKEYSSALKEVLIEEGDVQTSRYENADPCFPMALFTQRK